MLPSQITFRSADNRKRTINIIHADDRLLIVDKPPAIPVIPDRWQKSAVNLRDLLHREVSRNASATVQVVHRIDQNTSGLLVFALDAETHRQLSRLFEENLVDKTYLCFCRGQAHQPEGTIDLQLQMSSGRSYRTVVSRNGKAATTHYKVLRQYRDYCLVQAKPLTGRTHQIRAHLQHIGLPLAVDPLYGDTESLSIFDIKRRRQPETARTSSLIDRLTLHATSLSFSDPQGGEKRSWESPLPADMEAVKKALDKYGQPGDAVTDFPGPVEDTAY